MRIPPLLVGLSLAANLGLAIALLSSSKGASPGDSTPTRANEALAGAPVTSRSTASAGAEAALSPEIAKALPDLFQQLISGDFSTEIARLRASGLPEDTVNMIAQVAILRRFRKAYEEMGEDGMGFMWGGNYARTAEQREKQKKMRAIQDRLRDEARDAGISPNAFFSFGGKVPGLSEEKAAQLARLEADRMEMQSQVHMESSGMMLDRDTERLKFIEEEYRKDLAALLSPEELEAWKMHSSETARGLRAQLAYMAPTDEEFRGIFKLQDAFNEAWPSSYGGGTDWQKRSEAEQAMKEQIESLLGPERAAGYRKATDWEFGTLSNIEYRLELPQGSADRVYTLHQESEKTARKIRSDKSLSEEDKKESLKVLAEQVKSELSGVLGEEGLKAYRNQHSHWIDSLER